MKTYFITILLLLAFLNSCEETHEQVKVKSAPEATAKEADDIVISTSIDKDGRKLELFFNNTKGIVTLNFDGETIQLVQQRAASGIWYKNENYELRGKGNDIVLRKEGQIIFEHKDNIESITLKNKAGQTLDMTINHTTNEVKVYLNGGEQIELVGQKPKSGNLFKNEYYELKMNGKTVELIKDGKTIFKSSE